MKTSIFLIKIVLLLLLSLSSCESGNNPNEINSDKTNSLSDNNSIKSDAQKLVNLQCKVMKLIADAKNGDQTAFLKSEEFNQEAEKVSRSFKDKYSTQVEQEAFAKAYEEALGNCK